MKDRGRGKANGEVQLLPSLKRLDSLMINLSPSTITRRLVQFTNRPIRLMKRKTNQSIFFQSQCQHMHRRKYHQNRNREKTGEWRGLYWYDKLRTEATPRVRRWELLLLYLNRRKMPWFNLSPGPLR